jgi:hypothetical protein
MHRSPSARPVVFTSLTATSFLVLLWLFPSFWYRGWEASPQMHWFTNSTDLSGWSYLEIPVGRSAERLLVADRIANGTFTGPDGQVVNVFLASRYSEHPNAVGLFVHTPDRCWVQTGWQVEPTSPDCLQVTLHGLVLAFERRIFRQGQARELVYFTGLAGGQPLPHRLDHELSIAARAQQEPSVGTRATFLRATDQQYWTRVWDAFRTRRPLAGPKQFLTRWLQPANLEQEIELQGTKNVHINVNS